MASSNRQRTHTQQSANGNDQVFLITLTNHSTLLQNTSYFQQAPDVQYIEQRNSGIFISNRPVNIGIDHSEQHERFLYNDLRFELEHSIRAYLQRTRRPYPISMVLDLSNIHRRQ
ncbi:unnamed protein product [Rotaria socialis]|uniref:Uncharacterized protein n=1 Tax=Rotaria socialis TaxID=392032 RepID=A0A820VE22_9BILA|nr:unnamed protein product [Rotaria socialis]CAF4498507.1 unnamed protein product [Rotaria socialis]